VSQEKKPANYMSGTYFINPKLIEEMRQAQRQKRQLSGEQGEVPTEQHQIIPSTNALDPAGEQKIQNTPNLAGPQSSHINTAHIQPPPN
jgi:hypothetical protein